MALSRNPSRQMLSDYLSGFMHPCRLLQTDSTRSHGLPSERRTCNYPKLRNQLAYCDSPDHSKLEEPSVFFLLLPCPSHSNDLNERDSNCDIGPTCQCRRSLKRSCFSKGPQDQDIYQNKLEREVTHSGSSGKTEKLPLWPHRSGRAQEYFAQTPWRKTQSRD